MRLFILQQGILMIIIINNNIKTYIILGPSHFKTKRGKKIHLLSIPLTLGMRPQVTSHSSLRMNSLENKQALNSCCWPVSPKSQTNPDVIVSFLPDYTELNWFNTKYRSTINPCSTATYKLYAPYHHNRMAPDFSTK